VGGEKEKCNPQEETVGGENYLCVWEKKRWSGSARFSRRGSKIIKMIARRHGTARGKNSARTKGTIIIKNPIGLKVKRQKKI